jgi:hypothetical protein
MISNTLAIAARIDNQLIGDRRFLVLAIFLPLIIFYLFKVFIRTLPIELIANPEQFYIGNHGLQPGQDRSPDFSLHPAVHPDYNFYLRIDSAFVKHPLECALAVLLDSFHLCPDPDQIHAGRNRRSLRPSQPIRRPDPLRPGPFVFVEYDFEAKGIRNEYPNMPKR